jgi:hypothetical protein
MQWDEGCSVTGEHGSKHTCAAILGVGRHGSGKTVVVERTVVEW